MTAFAGTKNLIKYQIIMKEFAKKIQFGKYDCYFSLSITGHTYFVIPTIQVQKYKDISCLYLTLRFLCFNLNFGCIKIYQITEVRKAIIVPFPTNKQNKK